MRTSPVDPRDEIEADRCIPTTDSDIKQKLQPFGSSLGMYVVLPDIPVRIFNSRAHRVVCTSTKKQQSISIHVYFKMGYWPYYGNQWWVSRCLVGGGVPIPATAMRIDASTPASL